MYKKWSSLIVCLSFMSLESAESVSPSVSPTEETVLVKFKDEQRYYPKALIEQLPLYKLLAEDLGADQVISFLLEDTPITQEDFDGLLYVLNKVVNAKSLYEN